MAKLWRRKSKMLLVGAVLISLSGFAATIEEHKCYWCGPLADQVHRSRRSKPCDNSSSFEEITCDPSYDYCAVITTTNPLTESRVCHKVYQDECYSVYCNSSRHWRVVCPCRGELCNGPNTQRETEAFTTLFQKTKRSIYNSKKIRTRRALVASSNFISARRSRIENVTSAETTTTNNIVNPATSEDQILSFQPSKMMDNDIHSTPDEMTKMESNGITDPLNEITYIGSHQNDMETTPLNIETKMTAVTSANDEITLKGDSTIVDNIKSNKDMLTAEALQQSATADKLSTEIMTTLQAAVPTTHTASTDSMFTIEPTKNNSAPINYNQVFTSFIGIIIQHYL